MQLYKLTIQYSRRSEPNFSVYVQRVGGSRTCEARFSQGELKHTLTRCLANEATAEQIIGRTMEVGQFGLNDVPLDVACAAALGWFLH